MKNNSLSFIIDELFDLTVEKVASPFFPPKLYKLIFYIECDSGRYKAIRAFQSEAARDNFFDSINTEKAVEIYFALSERITLQQSGQAELFSDEYTTIEEDD